MVYALDVIMKLFVIIYLKDKGINSRSFVPKKASLITSVYLQELWKKKIEGEDYRPPARDTPPLSYTSR